MNQSIQISEGRPAPKCPLHVGTTMTLREEKGWVRTVGNNIKRDMIQFFRCPVNGCARVEGRNR